MIFAKVKKIHNRFKALQYDGSRDDLDWSIDARYLNFICCIKELRSMVALVFYNKTEPFSFEMYTSEKLLYDSTTRLSPFHSMTLFKCVLALL